MNNKRRRLLISVLGLVVALSSVAWTRIASAMCVCECSYECSENACYCSGEGDSIADCITCVAGACNAAKAATHCPIQ